MHTGDYTAFGATSTPPPPVVGFGYRGELTVGDGLVHLRARDYDPTLGVFTSTDPLDGLDGYPTVANP